MFGSFFGFKFRRVLEKLFTDDYEIKRFQPDASYIPDNETSILQSLKSLYVLNPRSMLYKVIIKIIVIHSLLYLNNI